MGEWEAFARMSAFSVEQRVKLFSTFLLTVLVDLTVAMEVGLAAACLVFVYRMSTLFRVEADPERPPTAPGVVAYRLYGALFFAATAKLEAVADALPPGTTTLVLDMRQLVSIDASGLDALENLHLALERAHVRLVLVGLNEQPLEAVRKWGLDAMLGAENVFADRDSAFAALAGSRAQ
jgi:SulP family sulfate permease